jgi:hypothetical protein
MNASLFSWQVRYQPGTHLRASHVPFARTAKRVTSVLTTLMSYNTNMLKFCPKCETDKEFPAEFSHGKFVSHSYCNECGKQYGKDHYTKNKARYQQQRKKRREESARQVLEYLLSHPCVDCPESDPACLDFDHVRGKKRDEISRMVGKCLSWAVIKAEIAKCDVRCANCHRKKTYGHLKRFRRGNSS